MIINPYAFAAAPAGDGSTEWISSPASRSNRNNYGGWVGATIDVNSTITITHLGRIFRTGNTGTHQIQLLDNSGTILASATVDCSSGTNGAYNYAECTPVEITAALPYYFILQKETSGGDTWGDDGTANTTTAVATVLQSSYRSGDTGLPSGSYTNNGLGVPSFKYTT